MREFNEKTDYAEVSEEIVKLINSYFIELQLLWLRELLMIATYLHLESIGYNFKNDTTGKRLVYQSDALKYVESLGYNKNAVTCLVDCIDQYAHEGSSLTFDSFKNLFRTYQSDLDAIAVHFGVKLNWGYIAYLECGEKQKSELEK